MLFRFLITAAARIILSITANWECNVVGIYIWNATLCRHTTAAKAVLDLHALNGRWRHVSGSPVYYSNLENIKSNYSPKSEMIS